MNPLDERPRGQPRREIAVYEAPSAEDLAMGHYVACIDCKRPWPLWLSVPTLHRCINDARIYWRKRRSQRKSSWCHYLDDGTASAMLDAQGGACAVCAKAIGLTQAPIARADLCSETETIRGLVCGGCLKAVTAVNGDVETVDRLGTYLRAHVASIRRGVGQKVTGKDKRPRPTATVIVNKNQIDQVELVDAMGVNDELTNEIDRIIAVASNKARKR